MPILKVRLNKLSNDWQVARAILEDEYASFDKTSNKFRTRYEFAAHLLEVHRLWCVRRALSRPACVPLRSDGGTADGAPGRLSRASATNAEAAQSKIYVSTSTQTGVKQEDQDDERSQEKDKDGEKRKEDKKDDGKHSCHQNEVPDQHSTGVKSLVTGTNSSPDLLIKLEVVSHENHDVDMESSQDHSTSHQGEGIPTDHNGSDLQSHFERTLQSSGEHIKKEVLSHENPGVDIERSVTVSTSEQRHGEQSSTKHIGSESCFENSNPSSGLLIKKELLSQEPCYGERKSRSHQVDEEEISAQHNGSDIRSVLERTNSDSDLHMKQDVTDKNLDVDMVSSPDESTSHQRHEEGIPTENIGSDREAASENIGSPSRSTTDNDGCSLKGSTSGLCHADRETASESFTKPSRSTSDNDEHSLEGSSASLCDEGTFSNKNPPRSHRKKSLLCKVWSKNYSSSSNNSSHLKTHPELNLHNQRRNSRKNPYQVLVCERDYATSEGLAVHMKTHTTEKHFECNFCSYRCSQNSVLTIHMRTHTGEKPFQCNTCGYRFSCKSHLTRHMKRHTGEKPFHCNICSYRFSRQSHLTRHMRTHTGDKPFQCNSCGYGCSSKNHLTNHMRQHSGEKPYQCSVCNKAFALNGDLSIHMRTHTGEKPFECIICGFRCTQKSNLTRHMRTHTGEKPFECNICSYRSSRKNVLILHMKIHSGEKPFECNICSYRCLRKSSLASHIIKKHTREKS